MKFKILKVFKHWVVGRVHPELKFNGMDSIELGNFPVHSEQMNWIAEWLLIFSSKIQSNVKSALGCQRKAQKNMNQKVLYEKLCNWELSVLIVDFSETKELQSYSKSVDWKILCWKTKWSYLLHELKVMKYQILFWKTCLSHLRIRIWYCKVFHFCLLFSKKTNINIFVHSLYYWIILTKLQVDIKPLVWNFITTSYSQIRCRRMKGTI